MQNTTIHMVAPFHSRLMKEHWSHCAFTQITLKQIQIFKALGCHVIDYSNFGSESVADEHVELLNQETFLKYFTDDGMPGSGAVIGSDGWGAWQNVLQREITPRALKPSGQHVIAHTYGDAASFLTGWLPQSVHHLETHIGYDRHPFGAKRVFVSEAWRHYHFGKYKNEVGDRRWSWVVMPYYDENDWPFNATPDDYIAFMGRINESKGMTVLAEVAKVMPHRRFQLAGFGDIRPFNMPKNVHYLGVLPGDKRAAFLGNAAVQILPTAYVEPCAGSVIEGMLCGTPAVASSWGGFTESISADVSGYTASMLRDFVDGIEKSFTIDRKKCATYARERFTLQVATEQYRRVLEDVLSLTGDGWYLGHRTAAEI